MLVRVPGRPQAIRAFTDAERALAEQYAAQEGGVIVPLSAGAGDDPVRQNRSGGPLSVEPPSQA